MVGNNTTFEAEDSPSMAVSQMIGPKSFDTGGSTRIKYFPGGLIIDLSGLATANDIVAVQNPYGMDMIVIEAHVRVKTAGGSASAVLDVDVVAGAGDTGDDIFDGVDANTAALSHSTNTSDNGTNGEAKAWLWERAGATLDHLTTKLLVANAANLVAYLTVMVVPADMD